MTRHFTRTAPVSSPASAGEGDHRAAMVEGAAASPLTPSAVASLGTSPAEAGEETNTRTI
jgi:hypothetical protein